MTQASETKRDIPHSNPKMNKTKGILLLSVAVVIIIILILSITGIRYNYPMQKTNSTNTSTSQSANLITPGSFPIFSCPARFYPEHGNITSTTGLSFSNVSGIADYVIEPGSAGTITYSVYIGNGTAGSPAVSNQSITNWMQFYHQQGINESSSPASGIETAFSPTSQQFSYNSNYSVTVTMAALTNASQGTYWAMLSPGVCFGSPRFLITIGNSPYSGPVPSAPVMP